MMAHDVSLNNIIEVSSLDISLWLNTHILSVRVPEPSGATMNVTLELMPVMVTFTNNILLVTEMYVTIVGALPSYDAKAAKEDKDVYQELKKKQDILYRSLQSLETARDTVGRMMTAVTQSIRANLQ